METDQESHKFKREKVEETKDARDQNGYKYILFKTNLYANLISQIRHDQKR